MATSEDGFHESDLRDRPLVPYEGHIGTGTATSPARRVGRPHSYGVAGRHPATSDCRLRANRSRAPRALVTEWRQESYAQRTVAALQQAACETESRVDDRTDEGPQAVNVLNHATV